MGFGGSHTVRSLMSLPLKMMYSKVSSRGGMGRSVGRSSVPKERTSRRKQTLASQQACSSRLICQLVIWSVRKARFHVSLRPNRTSSNISFCPTSTDSLYCQKTSKKLESLFKKRFI